MPYTPGPWVWMLLGGEWHLCRNDAAKTVVLTTVVKDRRWDGDSPEHIVLAVRDASGVLVPLTPDHPDARLMRAAPDLLAVAEEILAYELGMRGGLSECVRLAQAAIAKAKGV